MTKREYAEYQESVRSFMESEGIENLSSGHIRCPECDGEWTDGPDSYDECPNGHGSREEWGEPYCSSHGCDCCGNTLQQMLEHATGYNREHDEVLEYQVCSDCVYYAEYGCLDDATMEAIDS